MKKFLVLLMLMLSIQSIGFAQTYQNEPDGFRDIKWGTDFETLKDSLIFSETDSSYGGINFYTRKDDQMTIGSSNLNKVEYGFWQGVFCSVFISTDGYNNWSGVHSALISKFGGTYRPNQYMDRYYWYGSKTLIRSDYNEISGKGNFYFRSEIISKKMEEWDKIKASEGAKTGF